MWLFCNCCLPLGLACPRQVSDLWVRASYHGRDDGWVLTANKRGPTVERLQDLNFAARAFAEQEAKSASSVASAAFNDQSPSCEDRPLTGGEGAALAAVGEDRPLTGGGTGKGAWVPPSEFPSGHDEGEAAGGLEAPGGGDGAPAGEGPEGRAASGDSGDGGGEGEGARQEERGVAGVPRFMISAG